MTDERARGILELKRPNRFYEWDDVVRYMEKLEAAIRDLLADRERLRAAINELIEKWRHPDFWKKTGAAMDHCREAIRDMDWDIRDVFVTVHQVPSMRTLQDVIYVAQELGALTPRYKFASSGGSFALPYSADLETDLLRLELKKIIVDTRMGNNLVLTEHAGQMQLRLDDTSSKVLLQLAKLDPQVLDSLAAVAWVWRLLKDVVPTTELTARIADYLAVEPEKVGKYLEQLQVLKSE